MRPAILLTPLVPWLALLASCGAPPKPPSVDEFHKRPVNATTAVELQVCRNDLQNSHLRAIELGRVAEASAVTQANIAELQHVLAVLQASNKTPALASQSNTIFTVRFDYGNTRVDIPADIGQELVKEAKAAPLVVLRGRTDGHDDTLVESRIARARAAAVSDYLVAAGVNASQIRATYQPIGDHVADNQTANGRGLNRRVEIEIYRSLPVVLSVAAPNGSSTH